MKVSKSYLKKIIAEELEKVVGENGEISLQEEEEMTPAEEDGLLPGFVFMSALATMSLAAVYLPSKDESEDF